MVVLRRKQHWMPTPDTPGHNDQPDTQQRPRKRQPTATALVSDSPAPGLVHRVVSVLKQFPWQRSHASAMLILSKQG